MVRPILICVICIIVDAAIAFSTTSRPTLFSMRMMGNSSSAHAPLGTTTSADGSALTDEIDADDVTCYVTNDEEVITEGEKPHVVCTSEPEEYAWFNGVDPKAMRKTDGTLEGAEQCVEVESHRGHPEWECV